MGRTLSCRAGHPGSSGPPAWTSTGEKTSEEKIAHQGRIIDLSVDRVGGGGEVPVVGGEGEAVVEGGRHPHRLEALRLQPLRVAVRVGALQEPAGVVG